MSSEASSSRASFSGAPLRLLPIDNLVMVFSIFVPGERFPLGFVKDDPTIDLWENQPGELTPAGKLQAYQLGLDYRQTYANFQPPEYKRDDIYVYSTNTNRSLMSAECVLAGLYPPVGSNVWSTILTCWQPIPVHSNSSAQDKLYPNLKPLSKESFSDKPRKYEGEDYKFKYNTIIQNEHLFRKWHRYHYGNNSTFDLLEVMLSIDNVRFREGIVGKETFPDLDECELPAFAEKFDEVLSFAYETFPEFRVMGNDLLSLVKAAIKAHTSNQKSTKMYLYSLHSVNIATMKGRLGLPPHPQTTASGFLTFELHKGATGQHVIKMREKLNHGAEVKAFQFGDGEDYIVVEEFLSIVEHGRIMFH